MMMIGAYLIVLVGVSYFTRASARRVWGALAGGAAAGGLGWIAIIVGEALGWWRVPLTLTVQMVVLLYLGFAISLSPIYLVTWRVARRFGWRGLILSCIATAVVGPPRDYLIAAAYPHWIIFGPGIVPVLADAAVYVAWVSLGHTVMYLVAGPASKDQLA